MSVYQKRMPTFREERIEINVPCTLNPWGVTATLENLSLTGAYLICENFPDDLLTTINGEIIVGDLKLPGEFIRANKIKIAMHFTGLSEQEQKQLAAFLAQFTPELK